MQDGPQTLKWKLVLADPIFMHAALAMFGFDKVHAVQIVWPDRNGHYPSTRTESQEQPVFPFGAASPYQTDPYGD